MPGEAYQSAVQRVEDLQAKGFNIKPPAEQETVNFREKMLAEHIGLVVDKTLHEWCQVRESIADSGLAADKAMEWVTTNLNVSHTNLFKLAAVGLLIPTSTSDCERGFSTLKRVKTTHRASLSPPFLNPLLPVGMLGPPIEKVISTPW
ncbi:uncharacterized protein LOC132741945 [Ruditapes philippinarum]|uniref:uncharacterized protein LOC132741945 n=1 Tax=Ruditapes philippinarum TaxID=129788 RepID=UPI00295A5C9E|nr:uncharacterized protein LOC132741945 [Ruditapes philippinarum]